MLSVWKLVSSQGDSRESSPESISLPQYFVFSGFELLSLALCILLDVSEYMAAVLMISGIGDLLDVVGIVACVLMFRWIGVISLFELVPGADVFPIFLITWLVWYFIKRAQRERVRSQKTQT